MRRNIFIGLAMAFFIIVVLIIIYLFYNARKKVVHIPASPSLGSKNDWVAPDTNLIPTMRNADLIRYGKNLIVHTSRFFGPHGSIAQISNGMNCGNCHIDAGTRMWGNNFSMVASSYPLFRNRSGKIETIEMRINDCFERSLNGKKPGDNSKEMTAMIAYLKWIGKDVAKGTKIAGAGTEKLAFIGRPADSVKGKIIYVSTCAICHGKDGQGKMDTTGNEYTYPPLWGRNSYNNGAGISQLSKFAGYIKNNMPFGITFKTTQLTNEEAWDVAAFVNSKPRPVKDLRKDWPDLSTKPIDYPFGPYKDTFSETQHKYGPYLPIQQFYERIKHGK